MNNQLETYNDGPEKKRSRIDQELTAQYGIITDIEKTLECLLERISPILTPTQPEIAKESPTVDAPPRSQISNEIETHSENLSRILRRLNNTIDRVEV